MIATRSSPALAVIALAALASLGWTASASASSPPTIESESVTNVTQHNATLNAEINPNGSLTKYKLQVDTTGAYNFYQADCGVLHVPGFVYCQHVTPGEPLPPGLVEPPESSIPAGTGGQQVSVNLASIGATLQPGTTYHYRAIAANGASVIEGPDQTFTTPSEPSSPSIESESATNITATDATLKAQINPNGLETSYRFRLEFGCFSSHSACLWISEENLPTGEIPPSTEGQSVSVDLNEAGVTLDPGWEYRYSVEATNSAGTTIKVPDQSFTTPSTNAPVIESESLSHLTPTDATLEAQINTEGLETTYEFELQTVGCSSHGAGCELAPHPVSLPSGKLLGSFVGQKVSLDLNSAGVTLGKGEWFYTVTARNGDGSATGTFHQFEAPLPGPPSIDAESASGVTEHDATLEAQINPESLEHGAHYQFQVVANPSEYLPKFACPTEGFPAHTSLCIGLLPQAGALRLGETPAAVEDQSVSLDLASAGMTLRPGTTYHYRVIAARAILEEDTIGWEDPIVYGSDQKFTTPSEPPSFSSQTSGTDGQLPTIQSPASASPSHHRRHHRRHKRGLHRAKLHRAKRAV